MVLLGLGDGAGWDGQTEKMAEGNVYSAPPPEPFGSPLSSNCSSFFPSYLVSYLASRRRQTTRRNPTHTHASGPARTKKRTARRAGSIGGGNSRRSSSTGDAALVHKTAENAPAEQNAICSAADRRPPASNIPAPHAAARAALLAPMPARLGRLIPHPGGSKGVHHSGIISIVCCSGGYSLSNSPLN